MNVILLTIWKPIPEIKQYWAYPPFPPQKKDAILPFSQYFSQ